MAQIPCEEEDRKEFKDIAAKEDISMERLFHRWILYNRRWRIGEE